MNWTIAFFILLAAVVISGFTSANRERRLYEELVLFILQLNGEEWTSAEGMIHQSDGALQAYKLHVVLGGLVVRKLVERQKDPDGRSQYRRIEHE